MNATALGERLRQTIRTGDDTDLLVQWVLAQAGDSAGRRAALIRLVHRACREQSAAVVGAGVGPAVGVYDGLCVGACVGTADGAAVCGVGASVGAAVGACVGLQQCRYTPSMPGQHCWSDRSSSATQFGWKLHESVGDRVGDRVGENEGEVVGACVGVQIFRSADTAPPPHVLHALFPVASWY